MNENAMALHINMDGWEGNPEEKNTISMTSGRISRTRTWRASLGR